MKFQWYILSWLFFLYLAAFTCAPNLFKLGSTFHMSHYVYLGDTRITFVLNSIKFHILA